MRDNDRNWTRLTWVPRVDLRPASERGPLLPSSCGTSDEDDWEKEKEEEERGRGSARATVQVGVTEVSTSPPITPLIRSDDVGASAFGRVLKRLVGRTRARCGTTRHSGHPREGNDGDDDDDEEDDERHHRSGASSPSITVGERPGRGHS